MFAGPDGVVTGGVTGVDTVGVGDVGVVELCDPPPQPVITATAETNSERVT
jgi:hypothetical protein